MIARQQGLGAGDGGQGVYEWEWKWDGELGGERPHIILQKFAASIFDTSHARSRAHTQAATVACLSPHAKHGAGHILVRTEHAEIESLITIS